QDPINIRWTADSKTLFFDAEDHGARNLYSAGITGGVKTVTAGSQVLTFDSMSRDLMVAGTRTDPEHPQDVVRFNLMQPEQVVKLTDVNGDVLAGKKIAKTEELAVTSSSATKVQAWIVKPPDFDPAKKY